MTKHFGWVLLSLLVTLGVTGCGGNGLPDNSRLINAFEAGRTAAWVGGHGRVTQVLADQTIGVPSQRFMVQIDDSLRVFVHHSLVDSERVPVERGDTVAFQGRYDFNASGGVISLTHHDPQQPGGGGWIRHEGVQYD